MSSSNSFTLLFVDLPPKTFVGFNLVSFNSAPNFHGITKVPPGLHFVYTSPDASVSIRHGRWLNLTSNTDSSIRTLKWSSEDESLTLLPPAISSSPSPRGLVDYGVLCDATSNAPQPASSSSTPPPESDSDSLPTDYPDLTNHISPSLVSRIIPSEWKISSISSSPRDSDASNIPGLTAQEASSAFPPDSNLNLLDIDLQRTWAEGDVGPTRTERARDRSWYLSKIISAAAPAAVDGNATGGGSIDESNGRQQGAKHLLGELQFCFLMVLTLANYSCLEQWKRILTVIFTSKAALGEIEGYFIEVLKILALELRHADDVEGGLFELRDDVGSAWLRRLVDGFGENVREYADEKGGLRREMEGFEKEMRERFGWERKAEVLRRGMLELEDGERVEVSLTGADEDEERGDWAPVVVET